MFRELKVVFVLSQIGSVFFLFCMSVIIVYLCTCTCITCGYIGAYF